MSYSIFMKNHKHCLTLCNLQRRSYVHITVCVCLASILMQSPRYTVPPKSKCAKRSRALSADQACSGGANIGELLINRSAILDTARISRLHSYLCSSQKCFNKYVRTFSDCIVDVSGSRQNATARKLVSFHACTLYLCSSLNTLTFNVNFGVFAIFVLANK